MCKSIKDQAAQCLPRLASSYIYSSTSVQSLITTQSRINTWKLSMWLKLCVDSKMRSPPCSILYHDRLRVWPYTSNSKLDRLHRVWFCGRVRQMKISRVLVVSNTSLPFKNKEGLSCDLTLFLLYQPGAIIWERRPPETNGRVRRIDKWCDVGILLTTKRVAV